jgi:hypothetical protein
MPTDVKAAVSAVVILVALGLAFWGGSPIRPEFDKFVLFTAVFFCRRHVDFSRGRRQEGRQETLVQSCEKREGNR